jgi:hypothetical protein
MCLLYTSGLVEFQEVWNELRLQQQLCDGILHSSDEKALYTCRVILSAVKPYFKTLYTNSLKGIKPQINKVNLHIPGSMHDLISKYAYADHCNVIYQKILTGSSL